MCTCVGHSDLTSSVVCLRNKVSFSPRDKFIAERFIYGRHEEGDSHKPTEVNRPNWKEKLPILGHKLSMTLPFTLVCAVRHSQIKVREAMRT